MLPKRTESRLPLSLYIRRFALPTGASLFGVHQAIDVMRRTGNAASAAVAFVVWSVMGLVLLVGARGLGLRMDSEVDALVSRHLTQDGLSKQEIIRRTDEAFELWLAA